MLSSLTIKQLSFYFFFLKASSSETGMQLILCRALRVFFIHCLFQSSLEEEVGLFGNSIPADSQRKLFNYMYSSESIFPRAERAIRVFSRRCQCFSIASHCSRAEQNRIPFLFTFRNPPAWVEFLYTSAG